jgi:tRNA(Ile)-lysidine synthase
MADVAARVTRTITRWQLIGPGDRVAIALSGGSDSVALAWLLRSVAPDLGATVAGLVHVNHGLRGADSDADEAFCRSLAARMGLPIQVFHRDVAGLSKSRAESIEVAARSARYESFELAAAALDANLVATGHTEDDQAETVLLRLIRGTGTRGLSGIRVRRGPFIRPLLETTRVDLQRLLVALGETWREDASNADRSIIRNRVRHELVPVLRDIAPGGVRALARLAFIASEDESFLEEAANEKGAELVLSDSTVDAEALGRLPAALSRRLVRFLARKAAPDVNLSARNLEAVCHLAGTDKPGGRLDLPGLTVTKHSGRLEFAAGSRPNRGSVSRWPVRKLDVPGIVELPEAGLTIAASRLSHQISTTALGGAQSTQVVIPESGAAGTLLVRNRLPGDRFQPLGSPGRRKLQDVLVDRKVPRLERDAVPIVTDVSGEIMWVAGVALAERCRIRSPGDGVLLLELRKH